MKKLIKWKNKKEMNNKINHNKDKRIKNNAEEPKKEELDI